MVYFEKPGKEAKKSRKNIKPNDMRPLVGDGKMLYRFSDMWIPLSSLCLLGDELSKPLLVLLYRDTFLLDHVPVGEGYRYRPQGEVARVVSELDAKVRKVWPGGLLEMLCLFDILGWNEDVKYHSDEGRATFVSGKQDVGRINNMLTGMKVAMRVSASVDNVISNAHNKESIDVSIIIELMQAFVNGRGVAPASDAELTRWLAPYVHEAER